jgi:acetylglutamate kinase
VHGGGKDISGLLNDLDIQTEFVEGLRVTNEKVVEVAEMVLSGKINKELVQLLQNREISAVGLSGKDGGMIKVKKKFVNDLDIGYVGEIFHIDDKILKAVLKEDFLPVIAPIGTDKTGQSFNINADHVACAIAGHLKAEKLIYLTDTDGVYMDPENQDSIIHRLFTDNVPKLIDEGIISGGMIPKVESSVQALNEGVKSVHILDGKVEHSLLLELFTAAGVGTMIRESIV